MAQINIMDRWWSDPRRIYLIESLKGNASLADGVMLNFWRVAQTYCQRKEAIPKQCFDLLPYSSNILDSKLAVRMENGDILCRGANEAFGWLTAKKRAGKKGGKRSAEVRKLKYGSSQPGLRPEAKPIRSKQTKHAEPYFYSLSKNEFASGFKPVPACAPVSSEPIPLFETGCTLATLGGGVLSDPSPQLDFLNGNWKKGKEEEILNKGVQEFVGAYIRAYQKKFGQTRPELTKSILGQIKLYLKDVPLGRAVNLVQAYFQMEDKWFTTKAYDWSTFRGNQNKIALALDTGHISGGTNWSEFLKDANDETRIDGANNTP